MIQYLFWRVTPMISVLVLAAMVIDTVLYLAIQPIIPPTGHGAMGGV
ncbi:MAG: hypothetical protein HC876_05250 [Chloroflexaceae bacterium]|nr:hypothetical protein [Chloroflexaceae bacterium]NJO04970.1 hypothetical protein [Chloroflexaceae bacterium]NJO83419.1 hypothetical protein [Blastochloris sp.]